MARKITRGSDELPVDAEDRMAAIRYASKVEDQRYLICRGTGKHVPHLEGGRYRDWVRNPDGGITVHTHCERCGIECKQTLDRLYRPVGGWKYNYPKGEGGYLAADGEGASLVSAAGRAAFRQMMFEGVPDAAPAKKRR